MLIMMKTQNQMMKVNKLKRVYLIKQLALKENNLFIQNSGGLILNVETIYQKGMSKNFLKFCSKKHIYIEIIFLIPIKKC